MLPTEELPQAAGPSSAHRRRRVIVAAAGVGVLAAAAAALAAHWAGGDGNTPSSSRCGSVDLTVTANNRTHHITVGRGSTGSLAVHPPTAVTARVSRACTDVLVINLGRYTRSGLPLLGGPTETALQTWQVDRVGTYNLTVDGMECPPLHGAKVCHALPYTFATVRILSTAAAERRSK